MDKATIAITIPESLSDDGRAALLRALAVVVAVFDRATIPTVDDLTAALQAQQPKPDSMTR